MNRRLLIIAFAFLSLGAMPRLGVAGGICGYGHHGGHYAGHHYGGHHYTGHFGGHYGHHTGFRLSFGLGHGYYGHHQHYPSYSYRSYYPSYSSYYPRSYSYYPRSYSYYPRVYSYCYPRYSSYRFQSCSSPGIVVPLVPAQPNYSPIQPAPEVDPQRKVDPPPQVVPGASAESEPPSNGSFRLAVLKKTAFVSADRQATSEPTDVSNHTAQDDQLGPLLTLPQSHTLRSDEEIPWVVE